MTALPISADMPRMTCFDGAALGADRGFDESIAEMTGFLAGDHPAVIEADVARIGEAGDGMGIAVFDRMVRSQRFHRPGEAEHVAGGEVDFLGPVEGELTGMFHRHLRRIGDDHPLPLDESALAVLHELNHVARPVGRCQPALGFRRLDLDEAGKLAFFRPELAGVAELAADFAGDEPGLAVRRSHHQHVIPGRAVLDGLHIIGRHMRVTVPGMADFLDEAQLVEGVEPLGRFALGKQLRRRPVTGILLAEDFRQAERLDPPVLEHEPDEIPPVDGPVLHFIADADEFEVIFLGDAEQLDGLLMPHDRNFVDDDAAAAGGGLHLFIDEEAGSASAYP